MRSHIRRAIVAALIALLALAVLGTTAGGAQAASGLHGHQAKSKKKKKKKKTTTVLVKCAAVTVTCKGTPGAPGPAGKNGTNGTNGANGADGLNGAALVARATAGTFLTPTGSTTPVPANLTLSGNTWTQAAGELDYLTGSLNVTMPSTCVSSGSTAEAATLYLDGQSLGFIPSTGSDVNNLSGFAASSTFDSLMIFNALGRSNPATGSFVSNVRVLPPPASATSHTLTLGVMDLCSGGNHVTVNHAEIDVVAAK